jgi:uncharacterized protein (TIGR00255 family)
MESMTGYARVEGSTPQFSYSVEIKSLNNKYLETYVNLPRAVSPEELYFVDLLKKLFVRGKVELGVEIFGWSGARGSSIDTELLKRYHDELSAFRKKHKIDEGFSLDALLSLDGVVQKGRTGITAQSMTAVKKAVDAAAKTAIAMRKAEGKALESDLLSCVQLIADHLEKVKTLSKFAPSERFEILKSRLDRIASTIADENRLYSEVAILADRIDINEEITRLEDHVRKFRSTVKEKGQIGKKLDFIAQEMFREANTIASKTPDSEVSHLSVEIKNNIEKIREQCRNVV